MVVSLGIMGIIITMLFNILIVGLQSTAKVTARSLIREEVSNITSLIARDVRNAERVVNCSGTSCTIIVGSSTIVWSIEPPVNGTKVVKTVNGIDYYSSPDYLEINKFAFEQPFTSTINSNILITIVASHANDSLGISNVLRQQSISTRNYVL
jgi:hypothetical protein